MKNDTKTCEPCKAPCATCYSDIDCKTCGYEPEKRIAAPACTCKSQYIPVGDDICGECTSPCKTCDG